MNMETKTCEQYVLTQLFEQQNETDRLGRELQRRDERIDELIRQIEAARTPMQQAIVSKGRNALFRSCTGYSCGVKQGNDILPYEDWCLEEVNKYNLPEGVTLLGFIDEFEDELREEYRQQVDEEV